MAFTSFLLLLVLIIVISCSVANPESRGCALFGHGHISTFAGEQFQITEPGDYMFTEQLVVRMEQCPGSTIGAVCPTAINIGEEEVYYDQEANTIECWDSDSQSFFDCPFKNTYGAEQGYYLESPELQIVWSPAGSVLTENVFSTVDNSTIGLCGKRRFLASENTDVNWNKTADLFDPSSASQDEINQFAHTHTVNTYNKKGMEFKYRTHPADTTFGDFSNWKSFMPKSLTDPACERISDINPFLGRACAYDVKAAESIRARTPSYLVLMLSCRAIPEVGGQISLVGLFPDYDDLAKCKPFIAQYYMDAIHYYKNTASHPFDPEIEALETDRSIVNSKGSVTGRFAITPNHNVGGKYRYSLKYRDECGQEVDYVTNINITCNKPPQVDAGDDFEAAALNSPVILTASISDEDDDKLTVSWKFTKWPEMEDDQFPSNSTIENDYGYGSEYFQFSPQKAGQYEIEVAVSDYCNVVFDTITANVLCSSCSEKLHLISDEEMKFNAKNNNGTSYSQVEFDALGADGESYTFESVDISVQDSGYTIRRKEQGSSGFWGDVWEVRNDFGFSEPDSSTSFLETSTECVRGSFDNVTDDSFMQQLRIPPYGQRGKTVLDYNYYDEDEYASEFRRTGIGVLHHQLECVERRTVTETTITNWDYNPPTSVFCKLENADNTEDKNVASFSYERIDESYTFGECNHLFDFSFDASGPCSTNSASASVISWCPLPQANPISPDIVYFDYDNSTWPSVVLHGEASSSGALEDASSEDYPQNWLNYQWSIQKKPDRSSLSWTDTNINTRFAPDYPGEYIIELQVDNNCRSHTGSITINAFCSLPAPTNMSSISLGVVNDHDVTVNVSNVEPADPDTMNLETTVTVFSWPQSLTDNINKFNEYLQSGNKTDTELDSKVVATAEPSDNFNIRDISYNSFKVAGQHEFEIFVRDNCQGSSITENVTLDSRYQNFDLSVTVNGNSITDGEEISDQFDSSGYPEFDIEVDTTGSGIDSEFIYMVKQDGTGAPSVPDPSSASYTRTFTPDKPGSTVFEYLVADSDRCYIKEFSFNITVTCPNAPTLTPTSNTTIEIYSTEGNLTEPFTLSAEFGTENGFADEPQWAYDDGSGWTDLSNSPFNVVSGPTVGGESTEVELEAPRFLEIGTYHVRVDLGYSNDNNNGCGYASVTYTINVNCPRPDVQAIASSPSNIYYFSDNRFPTIRLAGDISGYNEHITPIEDYRYSWVFTQVPDNSVYFSEEETTGSEYLYDEDTQITETENEGNYQGRDALTGKTRTKQAVKYYHTHKVYRHSVLNLDKMSSQPSGDPTQFGFMEFSIAYDEKEADFDAAFIPDVPGTYQLRFETRPTSGSNLVDHCSYTDTVTIKVECNDKPSVSLDGADSNGVLSVNKNALYADRVQLSLSVTNYDETMLHSEFISTPFDNDEPVDFPTLRKAHTQYPSFFASRAGDYKIRVTADHGCSREEFQFTVSVTCSNGISLASDNQYFETNYFSKVDLTQLSFPVVPDTNDNFGCMIQNTPNLGDDSRQSGLVDIKLVFWEEPDIITEPIGPSSSSSSSSSSSKSDSDSSKSDSGSDSNGGGGGGSGSKSGSKSDSGSDSESESTDSGESTGSATNNDNEETDDSISGVVSITTSAGQPIAMLLVFIVSLLSMVL